jgi:hypothetical protein
MMTTVINRRRLGERVTRAASLCLLALAALLLQTREARAQWTQPDAQGNINTTNTGNVGIGTTTPTSKLVLSANAATPPAPQDGTIFHIVNADNIKTRVTIDSYGSNAAPSVTFRAARGTAGIPSATQLGDPIGIVYGTGFGSTQFLTAPKPAMWMVATENWTDSAAGSAIYFNTVRNGTAATVERMRINNDGNVGIGTATPTFLLDVTGTTNTPFRVRDSSGREYFSTTTRTGPVATWVGPVVSLAGSRLIVDSTSPDGNNDTLLRRAVNSLIVAPSDHPTLPGAFAVRQVGGIYGLFVDQSANGNVGIGTTSPQAKLDVSGNLNASGTITGGNIVARYQDVAEWVPSTQKLAAGTVVILDIAHDNHVEASRSAYDTRVAGVVSAQPGISLGEAGEGKALVATTGRVKVKVDATLGAIHVGDLLVTSDVPGVAMRSHPLDVGGVPLHRPGTLIGKALESLDKGTGEILVLLSLQ